MALGGYFALGGGEALPVVLLAMASWALLLGYFDLRAGAHSPALAEARLDVLERVTAAAFGQRRKMLRSSLKSLGNAETLLSSANIDPTRRAEELTVEEFCALARSAAT
jgi:hypothetical protein